MSELLSVPWLRSGTGKTPAEGGCILQVVDWVSRNQWTDAPPCVHPALRSLAIRANDTLPDDQRQKLLDLAPRLMGTNSHDKALSVGLAVFCARQVLPIWEAKFPQDDRPRRSIEAAEAWIADPSEENRQKALEARWASAASAASAASVAVASAADAASAASAASVAVASAASVAVASAASAADAASAASAASVAVASAADAAAAASASAAASYAKGQATYDLLVAVLDEYDRLTDRNKVDPVDLTPAAVAMAGVKV